MPRISSETLETSYVGARLRPILPCDDASYELVSNLIQPESDGSSVDARAESLERLAEDPHATMVAEFAAMRAMYKDRVVEVLHETGEREIRFATRSWSEASKHKGKETPAGYRLDDVYSATFLNDGTIRYTIVTMNV